MSPGPHEALSRARAGHRALVGVSAATVLAIDCGGGPAGGAFRAAVEALNALACAARFGLKHAGGASVEVPPLEGLFSSDADGVDMGTTARERLSRRPLGEPLDAEPVERARARVAERRPLPARARVRVQQLDEGLRAQTLHDGPYADEPATVARSSASEGSRRAPGITRSPSPIPAAARPSGSRRSSGNPPARLGHGPVRLA